MSLHSVFDSYLQGFIFSKQLPIEFCNYLRYRYGITRPRKTSEELKEEFGMTTSKLKKLSDGARSRLEFYTKNNLEVLEKLQESKEEYLKELLSQKFWQENQYAIRNKRARKRIYEISEHRIAVKDAFKIFAKELKTIQPEKLFHEFLNSGRNINKILGWSMRSQRKREKISQALTAFLLLE